MTEDHWVRLRPLLLEASIELFASRGITLRDGGAESTSGEEEIVTFISFTGEELKGSLAVVAPLYLLACTHPAAAADGELQEADMQDWAGEIANQILGRLAHKLYTLGVRLRVSPPHTLIGAALRAVHSQGLGSRRLCLRGEDGSELLIYFHAAGSAQAQSPDAGEEVPAKEGEVLLF